MRVLFLSLAAALIAITSGAADALAQTSALPLFTINLSLGSSGAQVIVLQQLLNRDPDTRVASVGPGSPGYETAYFGSLTQAAVIRFQNKYASEVLVPVGLSQSSGYVGLYTRTKLNALSALATNTGSVNAHSSTVSSPTASSAPATGNPNVVNLDRFLTDIDTEAIKQGVPAATRTTIKEQVTIAVATTTNLRAAFLKAIHADTPIAMSGSFVGRMLATVAQMFDTTLMPRHARAALGTPFGGALIFPFFCSCSDTWLIDIEPLPPTYVTLLTYVPFSEKYLSYNIPATNELLGTYIPGAGVCLIPTPFGCPNIPSEGMITPMVGSSPSP